jgi:hypothetical protein
LDGVKALAPTGDTIGFLARSLSDIELIGHLLGLFHNTSPLVPDLTTCKFAFVKTDQYQKATPDLTSIWAQPNPSSPPLELQSKKSTLARLNKAGWGRMGDIPECADPRAGSICKESW